MRKKARLIIKSFSNNKIFKLFSFTQSSDASITISSNEFSKVIWQSIDFSEGVPKLISEVIGDKGKLTIHGSGVAAVRKNEDKKGHKIRIPGNHLMDLKNEKLGVRHMITAFCSEPKEEHQIMGVNDFVIESNEFRPFVIVLLAIPIKPGSQVNISASFNEADLEENLFEGIFGNFDLRYHNIVWFKYFTRNMVKWPKDSLIAYHDGYTIPMYIGRLQNEDKTAEFDISFVQPVYSKTGEKLDISINATKK